MERAKLKTKAKKSLNGKYTPLVLSLLVFVIAYLFGDIFDLLLNTHYLASLFMIVAIILFNMGFINSVIKTARGKRIEVDNLFKHTHLSLKYLIITLIISLILLFLALLLAIDYKSLSTVLSNASNISFLPYTILVIVGSVLSVLILAFAIYIIISFSQVYFILNDEPDMKIGDIITMSFDMLDGYRLDYLVLCLSFIGWLVLGLFTLGILYLWVIPYMLVTFVNFYDKIKDRYSYSKPLKEEKEKI